MIWRNNLAQVCLGMSILTQGCGPDVRIEEQTCVNARCDDVTWAQWPMPHPPNTGLPDPFNYEVDAEKGVVLDKVTKLMWQREISPSGTNWIQAKTYCNDLELGGYDDWRLPTRIELVSIVDFTNEYGDPAINATAFTNTPIDWFWSSSPWPGSSSKVFVVNFLDGVTSSNFNTTNPANDCRVRCVR
ncbi:MAG TPA: DUF1566 domain-containing protein [Polyangium sp.]|nr:DUF1566 domain-containing protein [Polyangium sp.]